MNKNIFHIIDNLDAGGAQEIVYSLAKYIRNYETTIVSLYWNDDQTYIHKILPFASVSSLAKSRANIPLIVFKLYKFIQKNRGAIFNFHLEASCILGSLIRWFLPFRMVVTIHAHPSQLPGWKNWLYYKATKVCDFYIAADKDTEIYLQQRGVQPVRIQFIALGTEKIYPSRTATDRNVLEEFKIQPGRMILLNVARMVIPKGQSDLIHLIRILKDDHPACKAHLIIVGYGPEFDNLKNQARELGVEPEVTFTDKRLDLHNFYSVADWFIMPCYDESMGMVVYEALGYRVPVIAYNSGSIGEVIIDRDMGFLTDKNPRAMAAIISSTSVDEIKACLRQKDLSIFSPEKLADAYSDVYDKASKS